MPIDWFHGMSDEDVLSVVAYLRSLPPVKNAVPQNELTFVAKALFTFGMVGPKSPVTEVVKAPPRGVSVEYGKYLSNNIADCADCHTPRNLQDGKFYLDSMFAGSSFAFGGGPEGPLLAWARNITPDAEMGIGSWTEEQFFEAVTSGMRPDGTVLAPIMPYATVKYWDPQELAAVYMYLKTLPAFKRKVPAVATEPKFASAHGIERGGILFTGRCQPCHGDKGAGGPATKVTLAEVAPGFTDADLTEFIRDGQLNLHMPAFGKTLKPDELTDIVAHIRSWDKP
jgi:mono/diheme cytochrome c family protein